MGDSTAITIEFLRARLHSERSISRTARQRADQLAKRVSELEDQLRIVTIQRKKAEKAAVEVLSILETQGIGVLSEAIDSSSDQADIPCIKSSDDSVKGNESSPASRMERSEVEDGLSASEPEVSLSQGKSLSWRSHSNSPGHLDKQRAKEIRQRQRRRNFMSTVQSCSKHHSGKSCRKIKRRDTGSVADTEAYKLNVSDANGNGKVTLSSYCDDQPRSYIETSRGKIEEAVEDTLISHSVDNQDKEAEGDPFPNQGMRDTEMERALEKQAQLIGQFEAEENAQREWEEKYSENKMSNLACYEPENQSSVAEYSSQQPKNEATELAGRTPEYDEKAKLRAENNSSTDELTMESLSSSEKNNISKEAFDVTFFNSFVHRDLSTAPSGDNSNDLRNALVDQQDTNMEVNEIKTIPQEFVFPAANCVGVITNGKHNPRLLQEDCSNCSRVQQHGQRIPENTSTRSCSTNDGCKQPKLGPLKIENQLSSQMSPASNNSLGGVLDALQRAKLSLSIELSRLPSPSQVGTLAIGVPRKPQARPVGYGDDLDIPVGSAGLFRLPTDSFPQAQPSRPKFYGSGFSLGTRGFDVGYATSSYRHQNLSTSHVEAQSRISLGRHFDHNVSSGIVVPDCSRYSLTYPDMSAEGASFRGELSKSYSDVRNGLAAGDHYLYGADRARPDMELL